MPGEVAPAHRHSQSALRFIIEGHGAYTAVEGERTMMEPGDFVITPTWTWHDHGNDTDQPMVWLDGLDIQIVRLFDASFAEPAMPTTPDGDPARGRQPGALRRQHAAGRLESRGQDLAGVQLSLCAVARGADALARNGEPDAYHGHKLRYVNPASGELAMPTIGTFMQLLPAGFASQPYRSTDGTVFVVRRRRGRDGDRRHGLRLEAARHLRRAELDAHRHRADERGRAVQLLRPAVQEKLGLWREERGNA